MEVIPVSITEEIDDEQVEYYADGHPEEVEERARRCEHIVFHWTLDTDEEEWRKECIFCPAVLETKPSEEALEATNGGNPNAE